MGTIQFASRDTGPRVSPHGRLLAQAATDSRTAPSIFNSQPWRWRINDDVAELRADRTRGVTTIDPDGRLLTLSCGAALHHARTALEAAGYRADVVRFPDPTDPDLLATIRIGEPTQARPGALRLHRSMFLRHTDCRLFAERPVPAEALERLRIAAEREGASLHLHVAERQQGQSERYAILATDGDSPRDWLVAGEALSAVLLQAAVDGLVTSLPSDLDETPTARMGLRDLMGNIGHPAVVVRIGLAAAPAQAVAPSQP